MFPGTKIYLLVLYYVWRFLDVTVEKVEEETPASLNWPLYIFIVQSVLAGFLVHMDILKVIVLKGKQYIEN